MYGIPTSFCNLGKREACASLKVDIIGVNKCAECSKRLATEEVCFGSLLQESVKYSCLEVDSRYTFSRYCNKSATASLSLSARIGS